MQSITTKLIMWLLVGVCMAFVGCESNDDGSSTPRDYSGTWNVSAGGEQVLQITITQNGSAVSGSVSDGGSFSGTVNGNTMTFSADEVTGSVSGDGNTASGSMTENGETVALTITKVS